MSFRRPPRLALWLLEHVWVGAYGDALAGDLIEHFQTGHSRWWFWRQVGYALVIASIPSTLHKLLAAFGLVALGVGTFAWASVDKQGVAETRPCAQTMQYPAAGPGPGPGTGAGLDAARGAACARADRP